MAESPDGSILEMALFAIAVAESENMNLRASSAFRAGSFARLEAVLVPKLVKGVTAATQTVFEISQGLVHVDTGELKDSGSTNVEWTGTKVTGYITYTAGHAADNEFGTGRRGAASPGAGPYPYKQDWPGMAAIPFMRPALDIGRQQTVDAMRAALGV